MTKLVTIYHNPACSVSRKALVAIWDAGVDAEVIEYIKVGWTRPQLEDLFRTMGVSPREVLRTKGKAEELGLTARNVSDEVIIDAMVKHPALVERPIVVSAKGAALCRPVEKVAGLLP